LVQNEQLQKIWVEWKNVILVTVGVAVTMTSLWWLPPILPIFGVAPDQIESTANQVMNAMWWVVFILAAQSIFSNRKKRQAARKAAEEAAAQALSADGAPGVDIPAEDGPKSRR
jgi:type VI protein secretion system component VasK